MESQTWPESLPNDNRIKAIQELTKGQEWANKLEEVLYCSENVVSDPRSIDDVVVQILGMFENTISIMDSCSFSEPLQLLTSDLNFSHSLDKPKSENFNESPNTIIPLKIKKRSAKRRKNSWTSTKVSSVLIDDGHAWRKYGQKEILNSKHQRSYYRCTYKFDQGCLATKQVQMIEDKPPNYKITYFGNHTCNNLQRAPPIILDSPDPTDKSVLFNFETKEVVEKKQLSPYLPTMKQELKDGLPTLGSLRHNHSSSCNNDLSWDPFTHVSQHPTESVSLMPSWLDHEEIVSSRVDHGDIISSWAYPSMAGTNGYHIDHAYAWKE